MKISDWALMLPGRYSFHPSVVEITRITAQFVWARSGPGEREGRRAKTDVGAVFSTKPEAQAAKKLRDDLLKPFEEREAALRQEHMKLNREKSDALSEFYKTVSPTIR